MKQFRLLVALFMITLLAGCANNITRDEWKACLWGTAIAGAGIGSIGGIGGAAAGTAGGALIGAFMCGTVGQAPSMAPEPESQAGHFWADDQDYDGVLDADDHCPLTPEGVAVDSNGCAHDSDGDGVPDYLDQCPETPLGSVVDTNGCPYTLLTLSDVHFEFDSARLTSLAKSVLNQATSTINAAGSTVSVEGHTDSTGSDDYNLGLSQRRAQSVVDYLVSQGVSSSKLQAKGYGESSPITSNATREGRSKNRRVEIRNR